MWCCVFHLLAHSVGVMSYIHVANLSLWIQIFNRINVLSLSLLYSVGPIIDIVSIHLQEWQNSIQKNAGLAFIELVNEGRWVTPLRYQPLSSLTSPPSLRGRPPLNCSCDCLALYDSGLKKNQWFLGGGWSGAWEHEDGLSVSSSLRSISARPNGIWEEGRGQVGGERASDHWFLCDTLEMALDFLPSFCHRLSFCFIYL